MEGSFQDSAAPRAALVDKGLAESTRPRCDCPMRAGLSEMCRLGRLGTLATARVGAELKI